MQPIDNQSEKNKRLKLVRKALKMSQQEMADLLGVQRSSLSKIENLEEGRNVPKGTSLTLEKFKNVDSNWFDTGEGEMFLINLPKKNNAKDIGELQYPIEQGDTPFIQLGEGQYLMVMPLVSEYAYAGYLSGYSDTEYIEELPKHTIVVTKYHRGQYRAFEIVGDSMDDNTKESIPDGSIVTGREIQKHHWTSKFHTHRYKDYVIVHEREGIVTKRIIHHDTIQGYITCRSLNPDKENYPDFDLQLDEVKQIFNIVNVSLAR